MEWLSFHLTETNWDQVTWGRWGYIAFNFLEGFVWWAVAVYVYQRGKRKDLQSCEWWYFLAFILFGISDFIEIQYLPVWLFTAKAIILFMILYHRSKVIKLYPGKTM